VWALLRVALSAPPAQAERSRRVDFTFTLDKANLQRVRRRESRYLLRSNLTETDPARQSELYRRANRLPVRASRREPKSAAFGRSG
jgi:hypothetical protein